MAHSKLPEIEAEHDRMKQEKTAAKELVAKATKTADVIMREVAEFKKLLDQHVQIKKAHLNQKRQASQEVSFSSRCLLCQLLCVLKDK